MHGRSHAVERRVEVLVVDARDALGGLLERQRDATTVEVDVDDLDEDVAATVTTCSGSSTWRSGQLGDVDQALDALVDADERERHQR